ncbi:MAG: glycosyltransferase [Pseudomonadota bacterium]
MQHGAADVPNAQGPPVIIYRTVPHYRRALYDGLYARLGALVVGPQHDEGHETFMAPVDQAPWLRRYPFQAKRGLLPAAPIRSILEDLNPRLIVAEAGLRSPILWDLLTRRRLRKGPPVVLWGHGWQMGRGFEGAVNMLRQYGRIAPFKAADGHIVYSHEGATFLRRHLKTTRIWKATNTLKVKTDADDIAQSIEATRSVTRPFTLLFCGRMTPDKRVPDLVRAFQLVLCHVADAKLILIGDGVDRAVVQRVAGSLWQRAIVWHGQEYDAQTLSRHYSNADVAVSAGSVGLSVNEALGHALPFVLLERHPKHGPFHHPEHVHVADGVTGLRVKAAGCSGQPNQTGTHKGHTDKAGRIEALAQALISLHRDRNALALMRQRSIDCYRSNLSMERYVGEFANALQQAAVQR